MKSLVQQTQERLKAVLGLVTSIREYDFPFDDSKEVLEEIDELIQNWIEQLQDQITPSTNPQVVRTFCERASDYIGTSLPVLGLIVRSAEPIGALELHWPLKQLTRDALRDPKAKLIISSDWTYSPFTLTPIQLEKDIVLVGMPMSESNNALVAPLAGHELGHNIWRNDSIGPQVQPWVTEALDKRKKWTSRHKRVGQEHSKAFSLALFQCEEIFCDIIGLLMFRESYLHAFRYLLATDREQSRSGAYPTISNRTKMLCGFARKAKISVPPKYLESFSKDKPGVEFEELEAILKTADEVAEECSGKIFDLAKSLVQDRKLSKGTPAGVAHVLRYFERLVPARKVKCFQDIINAAWEFELKGGNSRVSDSDKREMSLVSELTFKTCEVFQIESRLK